MAKELEGMVVSSKNDKTITVKVETTHNDPLYKKFVRSTKKFAAHDPENKYKVGDVVKIVETRPTSKTKRWKVVN